MLECISLPEKEDDVLGLVLFALWLCDPSDVLIEADREGVTFCLAYDVVELEHFHSLAAFRLVLNTVLIEGQLAMLDVLLRLQQDVEQLCLQPRWATKDKFGGHLSGQNVWMFIAVWDSAHRTSLHQRVLFLCPSG